MFVVIVILASSAFFAAERALLVKRRSFCKEIVTAILDEAKSEAGLGKESFDEKKVYFEQHWDEIVTSTEDSIRLIDDEDEQTHELNFQIELLKIRKEQFFNFEVEIEKN